MAIESTPTIYTVRDFLGWQRDKTLELRPPFQRNATWKPIAKSGLIDSLIRGYPVPALFLQDRTDSKSFHRKLVVVDGQQRLRTVLAYVDITCLTDADQRDKFSLMAIHDSGRAGKTFEKLSEDDKDRILSTRMNVNIVGSLVTESELLEIFRRMNTYGAHLNNQELRNAGYDGLFKEVSYRLAGDTLERWLEWGLFNRQEIAEMRDVEFTSDILLLILNGTQMASKKVIDDAYEDYANEFDHMTTVMERFRHLSNLVGIGYELDADVRRMVTKMWAYSLFDALQRLAWGGSISERGLVKPKRVPKATIERLVLRAQAAISSDELPEAVVKATRGAASDKASRDARVGFLVSLVNA